MTHDPAGMTLYALAVIAALAWVGVSAYNVDRLIELTWPRIWIWAAGAIAVCVALAFATANIIHA